MLQIEIVNKSGITIYKLLLFVWIFTAIVLIIYKAVQYVKYTKGIRNLKSSASAEQIRCKQMVEEEIRTIKAELICSAAIKVPMCMGILKKMILLPDRQYKEDELYYILKHEYMHLKNKDIHLKVWIEFFISLFWWNPCVYLLRHDLDHILEIRCDLAVVGRELPERKVSYLNTIISTIREDRKKNHKFVTAEFADFADKRKMKQRFHIVVEYENNKKRRLIGASIFCILFFLTMFSSYLFVIQSRYTIPRSDLNFKEEGVEQILPEELYIIKTKDGRYILRDTSGDIDYEIAESFMEEMVQSGIEIREE
jgi:beta-lactamase regulating signal transducer with metallopeptidase domain